MDGIVNPGGFNGLSMPQRRRKQSVHAQFWWKMVMCKILMEERM
jgi:hypothetical protein